ncbi:uncharacterized protein LOC143181877 [Calliopsis andreniformis]|uniref:uncharacterized protein LOC143181877 n=1 Tax=Calliopsis andreniformis TaxID=337506 RepID=UPI003FCCB5AA
MEITTTSEIPFERLAIDVVGPLPLTEKGNRFIITARDDLTKFSFAFPVPDHEAKTVAETSFPNSSGIFFNKKGIAQIANSKLTLLTHINITYLNDATHILHEYFVKTQGICTLAVKDPSQHNHISYHCERILKLIEDELDEIDRKHNILQQLSQQSSIRKKRGLINGVSYALKWIFGTPDADDAQYYEDRIKTLVNNNRQTQTLLKSQIQVTTSTIKNVNNSIFFLKDQKAIMNENVKRINEFVIQTNSVFTRLTLETTITQQITSLLALVNRITREYTQYIESIHLAEHNIISPLIITPEILHEELKIYKGVLNLIVKPEAQNIRTFYKLLQLRMITSNDIIIFALNIPLVRKIMFDVYELIPLPIQHNNSVFYSYIIPRNNYILLSQSKTQVTFLKELSDCIEYLDQLYICYDLHTTQVTTQPICEVNMLSPHIKEIPTDCETKTIKATIETWKYISNN